MNSYINITLKLAATLLIGRSSAAAFITRRIAISPQFRNSNIAMSSSPSKRVLVPIADDSEEIETTCITDTLTRFGADVVVASVKPPGPDQLVCKMSRGVKVCVFLCIFQCIITIT